MKKLPYTNAHFRKDIGPCRARGGFTIVEIIITVALVGLFLGIFVTAIQAYQKVRFETERATEAFSVAQQLAINNRGATSDSINCSTTARQTISENEAIIFDSNAEGGVRGDADLLISPRYSLYAQYLDGCSGNVRIIVKVTYGRPDKREDVESIAL